MPVKVRLDRVRIPGLQLKANMIHVGCRMVRSIAALLTQWAAGIDQIDQRVTCAKLSKTRFTGTALQITAEHIPVKRNHVFKIVHPDNQMVNVGDIDGVRLFHGGLLY